MAWINFSKAEMFPVSSCQVAKAVKGGLCTLHIDVAEFSAKRFCLMRLVKVYEICEVSFSPMFIM